MLPRSLQAILATALFGHAVLAQTAASITTTSLPSATVGSPYNQTLGASGGKAPYRWTVLSGSLPAGLSFSSGGAITGTPTTSGTFTFVVQVADSNNQTDTQTLSITVAAATAPLTVTTSSLANGTVGTPYSQGLAATGGTGAYIWSISAGSLPAGLTVIGNTISGIPTATGTSNFTVQVQDTTGATATKPLSITIGASAVTITTPSLPDGAVGTPYSQALAASGGTGGYTWSITAGALPAGLALSGGNISGTPTTAGTANFTVQVKDASGGTATKALSINIVPPGPSVTTSSLPNGTVGAAYSQTLSATGGTGGYTWSVSSGSLPAGLNLSAAGTISGTPTTPGTANFTVQVKDSSGATATKPLTITIAPAALTVTTSSLPNGTVGTAYSQALSATGGTGGYTWSVTTGALPAGLNLSAAGTISGTPTAAGTANFTVQVKDSSGVTANKALSITVTAPPLTVATSSLPDATIGTAYSQALSATGGTGGYTWSITAGALPAGLALSGSTISGTPTATGTANFTVQVKDSSGATATKALSITVAAPPLTVTTSSLPGGTVGTTYSQTLSATGGTGGYTWAVTAGSPPAGLNLNVNGTISGTPSTAGTANFTVQVKDSSGATATKALSIAIAAPALTITTASLPPGAVGTGYSQSLSASGGTGGYTWSLSSGSLPAGLSLSAAGGIAGTASTAGNASFTVQVKDSSGATATKALSLAIVAAITIASTAGLPPAVVGTPYSATLSASGGVAPYSWTVASGQLPPGLSLSQGGSISGTPSSTGTYAFAVQVSDASGGSAGAQASIAVQNAISITTPTVLSSGSAGSPYSQPITAVGGTQPYTWSLVSGTLPTGLSLNPNTGIISGTPTQTGSFILGIRVLDAANNSANASFNLSVTAGMVIATAPVLPTATVGVKYSLTLTAAGGTSPYQWSITAGALPAGLTFSPTGQISGTPTAAGNFAFTVQATDAVSNKVTKDFTLTVAGPLSITSAPTLPAAATGTPYRQALSAAGGTPPYTWAVTTGSLPGGLALDATTGTLAGTPASTGTFNFTVSVTDSTSIIAQQAFSITVGQGLTISSPAALPDATAGSPYNFTLSAAGGQSPYSWALTQGALPAGLSLDSTGGVIAGTPSAGGSFSFTLQVTDSTGLVTSRPESLNVALPALSGMQIAGLPGSIASAQQPGLDIALRDPYPAPINGVLNLSFAPAGNAPDDPSVQFSTGGRSATFTIPAGATHATFSAQQFAVQTGSVAGTITVSIASLQSGGTPIPPPGSMTVSAQVAAAAPLIRSVTLTPTSGGFQVSVVGLSNTREMTQATVTFQPASGSSLQTSSLVVPLGDAAKSWFQSGSSSPYGGQFTLTIPFSINGNGNVGSVSVVLSNTVGDSSPVASQ